MSDTPPRRRRIGFGEIIGLAALIISGLGVWISWQSNSKDGPTQVIEQRTTIPLTLRASVEGDGRTLKISPIEPGHALESLRITLPGVKAITVGSDGKLDARDMEGALEVADDKRKGSQVARVTVDARYVEAGTDRRRTATYQLRYHWQGGGLFGGRSLRFDSFGRS